MTCDDVVQLPEAQFVLQLLLEQPTEISIEVLQWLDIADLLNICITCHDLHSFVHRHGDLLYSRLCGRIVRKHGSLQFSTRLSSSSGKLLAYIKLQHQYTSIVELTRIAATHMVSRFRPRSAQMDKLAQQKWHAAKVIVLSHRLLPAYFFLNDFLDQLSLVFLRAEKQFVDLDDETVLDMYDVFDLDQQDIIERFKECDTQTIIDISAAFSVLLKVMIQKKTSISSRSYEYPFSSNKRIMLFYGLSPFAPVLRSGLTIEERRGLLDQYNEDLWRGKGFKPLLHTSPKLETIHHLECEKIIELGETGTSRGYRVCNKFLGRQDVWQGAALSILRRRGVENLNSARAGAWVRDIISGSDALSIRLGDLDYSMAD